MNRLSIQNDLLGVFLKVTKPGHWQEVEDMGNAMGVEFLCPLCFTTNAGPIGTHAVICWSRSRGTPEDETPGPGRWRMDGTGLHDLTLNADPPGTARSVLLTGGCGWHGFVDGGFAHGGF